MACSPLAVFLFSLVSASALRATSGQYRARVFDLQVVGGDGTKGYIEARVSYSNGTTATGPICGTVDLITATFACLSKDFHSSIQQGTVNSIGGVSQPNATPVVSSLSCNSYSSENGRVSYGCTFNPVATCAPGDSVAVRCSLTDGELAAVITVCVIAFLVCFFTLFTICLCIPPCWCCPKRATRGQRRAEIMGRLNHQLTSSLQPREQSPVGYLEPPEYQETVAEGLKSSPILPYKD